MRSLLRHLHARRRAWLWNPGKQLQSQTRPLWLRLLQGPRSRAFQVPSFDALARLTTRDERSRMQPGSRLANRLVSCGGPRVIGVLVDVQEVLDQGFGLVWLG